MVNYGVLASRQQREVVEEVVCPICTGLPARRTFTKDSYQVYRCVSCACEFLEPQPDDQALSEIYDAEYFLGDHDEASDRRVAALKSATSALYLDRLSTALAGHGRCLLEVGCGSGDLLLQAQSRSFKVNGVEYSTAAAAAANRRLGAELVRTGTIENAALPAGHFDVVVACDVIEHTRNPKSFLEKAHALLRPGGVVFLVTPSLNSWSRRLLGRRWMEYKVEHLFYFGQRSLSRLLIDAGFDDPVFAGNRKVLSLDYVYRHFERFPVAALTPLFRMVRWCTPERLAHRQWILPASGMFVTARKPAAGNVKG
jgi:SAM-dependent methyltransferase